MSLPTEGQRQAAHRLWNEILCNGGVPGWTALDAIAAELAEAEARGRARGVAEAGALRERVEGLHQRIEPPDLNAGFCTGCDYSYPCPTRRALDGNP